MVEARARATGEDHRGDRVTRRGGRLHHPDASERLASRQRGIVPVRAFRPVAAFDADGAVSGLLLWYPSLEDGGRWLECEVDALREGLAAAPTAPIVGFFPDDTPVFDVPQLVSAALEALVEETVVAPLTRVTDAVKRVEGRRIVSTVDRSRLRQVRGPAFARTDAVLRVLRGAGSGTIRPLVAVAQDTRLQIGRLDAVEVPDRAAS